MRQLVLTGEDMADLIAGSTINAMMEDGEEVLVIAPDGLNKDWRRAPARVADFPQTSEEARLCVHGNVVWFGHECGLCEDDEDGYVWADGTGHEYAEFDSQETLRDHLVEGHGSTPQAADVLYNEGDHHLRTMHRMLHRQDPEGD